jgi:3-dehydroquinate synthase class II
MNVYTGQYELTLAQIVPSDVETTPLTVELLEECVSTAQRLRCSPIVRDVVAKAAITLTALKAGTDFMALDVADQFNARALRAIMRRHAREMTAMIAESK